ncbi:hypothetical protein [Achromobacter aegrifaciens]|uniref:hypothetical protein n=1 Tax=Achromobacter aegrifaciens TaxID=1287736 RepID=UPI003208FF39
MAAPYSTTPKVGVDLNTIYLAADIANGISRPKLGDQVWTTDGKRAVFAQANASIPASTAVCTVSPTTFLATASGGAYLSPAVAMATGDQGWFDAASV